MTKLYLKALVGVSLASLVAVAAVNGQGMAPGPVAPASEVPGIMGVIKDRGGKPMAGVTVSARAADQSMTTSVYSDEKGVYVFPALAAGDYKVWAQATGFNTGNAAAMLDGSHTATRNITMQPLADYGIQLTGYEWFNSLPEGNADDKRMKQVMYVACTGCHSLDLPLQNRFDEVGWNAIVKSMENSFYNGRVPGDLRADQMRWEGQIIRRHREELARYLTKVRGPDSKITLKPLPRPSGDAARAVVTEYELPLKGQENAPSWYTGTDWSLGPSTGMHDIVGIHDVMLDEKGIAWITQARTTWENRRSLVRLDPKSGAMDEVKILDPAGKIMLFEQISSPNPKGEIWMHEGPNFVRLNPKTETFDLFVMPRVMGGTNNSMDSDSQGRAAANSRAGVTVYDPMLAASDKISAYPGWAQYQQHTPGDNTTYGISFDADDNLWWSASYVGKVVTRDMKTGKTTEFDMIDPEFDARKALATPEDIKWYESIGGGTWSNNSASPLPYANMPRRLSADKNGDTVWVPNWSQSNIAEINIHTHKVTYHRLPIQVHPYKTIVDRNHDVWTDTSLNDSVFRYRPSTGEWTMFRQPSHGCGSRHVSFDDYKGDLWLPCDQSNKVMRFQMRSQAQIQALKTAATKNR